MPSLTVRELAASLLLMFCAPSFSAPAPESLPKSKSLGRLEQVMSFTGSMPTGVTVSSGGRIFVNFPRWGDPVPFTVAEVRNGKLVAYPDDDTNRLSPTRAAETFVSVQSVVIDPRDRLWILDTGSLKFAPVVPGGAKLIGVDLASNKIVKTISFPPEVALPTSYLNDVRFDLRQGEEGVAYITDSSDQGPNGIVVVDLASGKSWRRLHDHPVTKAEREFVPIVEGQPVMQDKPGKEPKHIAMGSDGIAISADGTRLFFCALAGRRLYSVDTSLLRDTDSSEAELADKVRDEGMKPASDGMETDSQDRLYATAYEHNAILRRDAEGRYETLVHDPRALWPDTLSVANGYLYFIANQLHRQPDYHDGRDLRVKPYSLFRVKIDGTRVALR